MELHETLAREVDVWREAGYPSDMAALAEILDFATDAEPDPDGGAAHLRFFRPPQLKALETYWYLRLVKGTPHVTALYRDLFDATSDRLAALGLDSPALTKVVLDTGYEGLLERIRKVAVADIPERRQDLVDGSYSVARPAGSRRPVAVRITDMLGEEVLVIEAHGVAPPSPGSSRPS